MDNAVVSNNNKIMALTSYANKIHSISLWDINNTSLKMVKKFDFDDDTFFSNNMVFSHDNKYLAMGVANNIYIWDTKTDKVVKKISNYYEVSSLAFSHDDKYLVVGASKHLIRVFNVNRGFEFSKQIEGKTLNMLEKMFPKSKYGTETNLISFSLDDKYLIVTFEDANTNIYDIEDDYKVIKKFAYKEDNYILDVHFTSNGKEILLEKNDVEVEVLEASPPFRKIKSIPKMASEDEIYSTALSKNNRYYATTWDYWGEINIWDRENNFKHITTLKGHKDYTTSLQFYNDDKYLMSVGGDNKLIIWDVSTWKKITELTLDEEHHFTLKKN